MLGAAVGQDCISHARVTGVAGRDEAWRGLAGRGVARNDMVIMVFRLTTRKLKRAASAANANTKRHDTTRPRMRFCAFNPTRCRLFAERLNRLI